MSTAQVLKIDKTKCLTPANYAKKFGMSRSNVYKLLEKGELPIEKIDGVLFIYLDGK